MKFYEKFVNYLEKCNLTDEQYNNIMDLYHDINLDKLLEFEDYLDESVNNNVYDYESLYDKLSTLSNYYSFVMKDENEKEDVIDIDEDLVKITSAEETKEEDIIEHSILFDKITDVDNGILSKYYEGSLRDDDLSNKSADNYGKLYNLLLKIENDEDALNEIEEFLEENIDIDDDIKISTLENRINKLLNKEEKEDIKETNDAEELEELMKEENEEEIELLDIPSKKESKIKSFFSNLFSKKQEESTIEEDNEEEIETIEEEIKEIEEIEEKNEEIKLLEPEKKENKVKLFFKNIFSRKKVDLGESKIDLDDEIELLEVPKKEEKETFVRRLFNKKNKNNVIENEIEKEKDNIEEIKIEDKNELSKIYDEINNFMKENKFSDSELKDYCKLFKFRDDKLVLSKNLLEFIRNDENAKDEDKFIDKMAELMDIPRTVKEVENKKEEEKEVEKVNILDNIKNKINEYDEKINKSNARNEQAKELEEKINNYEEFLSTHDLSHKDDIRMLENIKNNLKNAKEELESIKNEIIEEKNNKKQENISRNEQIKFYTESSIALDKELSKIDKERLEKIEKLGVINLGLKEERIIDSKKLELLRLKKECLERKQKLLDLYNNETKVMSDAWYYFKNQESSKTL